jgi:hypothetical protein
MAIHLTRSDSALVREFLIMRKQLNLYLNHFPSFEKHGLSLRIRERADDVFEGIIKGAKKYHKLTTLTELDVAHEQLRALVYMAYEMEYFNHTDTRHVYNKVKGEDRYLCISKMIDSLGCLIGAWIKIEIEKENERKANSPNNKK